MKKRTTAILLCFFLGGLGVHRFYLGETGKGILYILTGFGLLGIIPFIDFVIWLLGSNESFDRKYNSQAIQKQQVEVQKDMLDELKKKNN
jgi:TM2 domain-containing membrane protein YozV